MHDRSAHNPNLHYRGIDCQTSEAKRSELTIKNQ